MQPLRFKYSPAMRIVVFVGLPLLTGLGPLMATAGIYLLYDPGGNFAKRAPGLLCIPLAIFPFWMVWETIRIWSSIFSAYSLDSNGIEVERKNIKTFLAWDRLLDVRYRIGLGGQTELKFQDFPGIVALNNVDLSADRKTINAALRLLEQVYPRGVRRTLI